MVIDWGGGQKGQGESQEQPAEFVLEFKQLGYRPNPDGTLDILMQTSRGDITGVLHPAIGNTGVVLFGGVDGPAEGVYRRLSPELVERGISAFRIEFRQRGELAESVGDMLAALSFLQGIGATHVIAVGASFGGAVAIRAGILSPLVSGVATLASQTLGAQDVERLAPKPILIMHGTEDSVLGPHNAQNIYNWAKEPKELVLYPGADHDLRLCKEELHVKLLDWLADKVGPDSLSAPS